MDFIYFHCREKSLTMTTENARLNIIDILLLFAISVANVRIDPVSNVSQCFYVIKNFFSLSYHKFVHSVLSFIIIVSITVYPASVKNS